MEKGIKEKKEKKGKSSPISLVELGEEPTKKKVEDFQAGLEEEKPKHKRRKKRKKEPELTPEEQEIMAIFSPEALLVPMRYVDGLVARGVRIRPASEEELESLSKIWGVVAQKRLPAWLVQYGDIVMAVGITTICYGGRVLERIQEDRQKKQKEVKKDEAFKGEKSEEEKS